MVEIGGWMYYKGFKFAIHGDVVLFEGKHYQLRETLRPDESQEDGSIRAPMTGKLVKVLVEEGESVDEGQILMVVEAMKMELMLTSPFKAKVKRIHRRVGEVVQEGEVLLELEEV